MLKTENLARLGHDERGLVPIDEQSNASYMSSAVSEAKPRSIEYLNKGKQQNETVRDFIQNSR